MAERFVATFFARDMWPRVTQRSAAVVATAFFAVCARFAG
jgi:hypothetical protein